MDCAKSEIDSYFSKEVTSINSAFKSQGIDCVVDTDPSSASGLQAMMVLPTLAFIISMIAL